MLGIQHFLQIKNYSFSPLVNIPEVKFWFSSWFSLTVASVHLSKRFNQYKLWLSHFTKHVDGMDFDIILSNM